MCTALYRRVLPVSCTSSVFSSVSYSPSCFVICSVYSNVACFFFFFFQCLHTPEVVIKFLPQMRQSKTLFVVVVLRRDYIWDVERMCSSCRPLRVGMWAFSGHSRLIKMKLNNMEKGALMEVWKSALCCISAWSSLSRKPSILASKGQHHPGNIISEIWAWL